MLGLDETDLWPEMRAAQSWPDEVRAIYPHRDAVPTELWRDLFRSAEREIGILADSGLFLAEDPRIVAVLQGRAQVGARVRICLRDPSWPESDAMATHIRDALALYGQLPGSGDVGVRLHRVTLNNSIYRADDELLVSQRAFGVPDWRASVLYLHRTDTGDLVTTYLESFDDIWCSALPLAERPSH
jgi:hypothetical protein